MKEEQTIIDRIEKGRLSCPINPRYSLKYPEICELLTIARTGDLNGIYQAVTRAFIYGYQKGTRAAIAERQTQKKA